MFNLFPKENNGIATKYAIKPYQKRFMQKGNNHLFGVMNGKEIGVSYNNAFCHRNTNVLVVGSAGTGKSYNYVESNLLQENHSAVVLDYSGTYAYRYAEYFRNKGHQVCVLDFTKENKDTDVVSIDTMTSQQTYLFIRYDPSLQEQRNLVSDYLSELITAIYEYGDRSLEQRSYYGFPNGMRLERHIQFYLDDFQFLAIPSFRKIIATCRPYNVGTSVIVQNIDQLERQYGENWVEIPACCDTLIFTGTHNQNTRNFIIRLLGTRKSWLESPELARHEQAILLDSGHILVFVHASSPFICDRLNPNNYKKK